MSKYTIDNQELKKELTEYVNSCKFKRKQNGKGVWRWKIEKRGFVSDRLGQMIKTIAEGLATKGNWRNYTWKQDFISYGILICLQYMHNFDPNNEKNNAHGYINMICSQAFLQYVQKEKLHSKTKQELYEKKDDIQEWDQSIDYRSLKEDIKEK